MTFEESILHHRKRSVPIIAVTTSDQVSVAKRIAKIVHDAGDRNSNNVQAQPPMVYEWDVVRGIHGIATNEHQSLADAADNAYSDLKVPADVEVLKPGRFAQNLSAALNFALHFQANTVLIVQNAPDWLRMPPVQQAIQNLRDEFKTDRRTLILVGGHFQVPANLRNDVVILDEPNPSRQDCADLIKKVSGYFNHEPHEPTDAEIDAIHGLPLFQAEQALSLSGNRDNFALDQTISLKKQQIETTRGLSVWNSKDNYSSIGGLFGIKSHFQRLFNGPKPPQLVVWLDEIEKSSIASTGDANGINSDMLGTMLSYMEDQGVYGCCFVGVPGSGKSQGVKSIGGEFNRMVVRLDLGGMKGSYVGESEQNLRAALRLISSVGNDNAVFVATSNEISSLDVALQSRFSHTFYFGMPTKEELAPIWEIQRQKYGVTDTDLPDDNQWVGRNVKQCCEMSYRFGMTLREAAEQIIPVGVSAAKEIEVLNTMAADRYLCASTGRIYQG